MTAWAVLSILDVKDFSSDSKLLIFNVPRLNVEPVDLLRGSARAAALSWYKLFGVDVHGLVLETAS